MKITSVRIGKLVSGPGYNNHSVALEAAVEDGEDWESVANSLRAEVDGLLGKERQAQDLRDAIQSLQWQISDSIRQRDDLQKEIEGARKVVRENQKLADLAREHGIEAAGLVDEIPF